MAFVSDTFTDTANTLLSSHTGEVGATWTKHPSSGTPAMAISNANRLRSDVTNFGTVAYYASGIPASADYDVECILRRRADTSEISGVAGRMDTAANTMYIARYRDDTDNWVLQKLVAGVSTILGEVLFTPTIDQNYALKLEMRATAIKLYVDGVPQISVTDSSISAAGRAGIRTSGATGPSDSVGLHLDSFVATDAVAYVPLDMAHSALMQNMMAQ